MPTPKNYERAIRLLRKTMDALPGGGVAAEIASFLRSIGELDEPGLFAPHPRSNGVSHDAERAKDETFSGDERDLDLEATARASVLASLRESGGWIRADDLRKKTGFPSADRRARELAEQGLIRRRREDRFVEYAAKG
jgi:uncharacterized membrane protein